MAFKPCQFPFLGSFLHPGDVCQSRIQTLSWAVLSKCKFWSGITSRCVLIITDVAIVSHIYAIGITYIFVVLLPGNLFLWEESCRAFSGKNTNLKFYRTLQVLQSVLNSSNRYQIFPMVAYCFPAVQILDAFLLIKYYDTMDYSLFMIVIVQYVQCLFCIAMLFMWSAKVYANSCAWLAKRKRSVNKGGTFERKFLRGLVPLKVLFGMSFVDELTPLVIEQFCVLQTINLLLLR